jgi:hypothetical protein
VHAFVEKLLADLGVQDRGSRDTDSVNLAEQLPEVGKTLSAEWPGDLLGTARPPTRVASGCAA